MSTIKIIPEFEASKDPIQITVEADGKIQTFQGTKELTLLENILDHGIDVPYSCMDGSCTSCLATITQGEVVQRDEFILSQDSLDEGECLTCQAYPSSSSVTVIY